LKNRLFYIYFAFISSFIAIAVISVLFLHNFSSIQDSDVWVEHTHEVKSQILKVKANLIEAENNQREILLSKGKKSRLPVSQTQKSTFTEIETLKRLTADNPKQQQNIKALREAVSLWYQTLYATIDDATDGELDHFTANIDEANERLQRVMDLSDQMDKIESALLVTRKAKKNILERATPKYLGIILFVSFIFQLISFTVIIEAYRKRKIHQKILEKKIQELNASNSELEQIAFVASHDLQEPLRKIRTFSDKLIINYKGILSEEGKMIVEKISASSQRVQELLNDLINYTNLTKNDEEINQIDLAKCFQEVCEEFNGAIKQKNAIIKMDRLPVISGYPKQLNLLFYNLLDNSLKFSKLNISPVINVSATTVTGTEVGSSNTFAKITFSDNGIGFEKEYSKKLFIIFKRLHAKSSGLPGKGIGLAICRKVMTNHNGYITAKGDAGVGASFNLYFPCNDAD
jgi:signal transduction histidine kinase